MIHAGTCESKQNSDLSGPDYNGLRDQYVGKKKKNIHISTGVQNAA